MQARLFLFLLVATFFLSFVACTDKGDLPLGNLQPGGTGTTYLYKAYNSKGELAVSGTMKTTVVEASSVAGTWSFVAVLPSEKVGPQTGTGTLTGSIQKSSISINLNPGWADNNVFLQGTVSSDSITGRWMWSTFIGPTAEGSFIATRSLTTQIPNI